MRVLALHVALALGSAAGRPVHEATAQLQTLKGHRLFEQVAEKGQKATAQKMEQTLSDAIRSAIGSSDPEVIARVGNLSAVMTQQMDLMKAAVRAENGEDQSEITAANQAVTDCNTDMQNSFTTGVNGVDFLNLGAHNDRGVHAQCRIDEDLLWTERESKRGIAQTEADTAVQDMPSCIALQVTDPESMYALLECMKSGASWETTHAEPLTNKIGDYDLADETFNNKSIECDDDQGDFETSFCLYADELMSVCGTHETCYDGAIIDRNALVASAQSKETSQKELWVSICRVECLIALFGDAASDDLTDGSVQACLDAASCNSDELNLNYPAADLKEPCDTETSAWNESEYDGMTEAYLEDPNTCIRKYSCGCADSTREGSFGGVYNTLAQKENFAGCSGTFSGDVSGDDAAALCAEGWHVCTGLDILSGSITVGDSDAFAGGCYIFNGGNQAGDACVETCAAGDSTAGVGSGCEIASGNSGCLTDGVRASAGGGFCIIADNAGVVCCKDLS